jgi:hypothetical protein
MNKSGYDLLKHNLLNGYELLGNSNVQLVIADRQVGLFVGRKTVNLP